MGDTGEQTGSVRVDLEILARFVSEVLETYDVPSDHADLTADVLVAADLAGIDSHGVSRLFYYTHKLAKGLVEPRPAPRIVSEGAGGCVIDGDNGLGPVASQMAMDWCLAHAADGVGACATVRRSNHYGIAGYYARQAVQEGMIGISLTNATTFVVPTFGRKPMFGTNPIAVAVPAGEERPFILDMATSAAAVGKLQLAMGAGTEIPPGWAMDSDGVSTTDPVEGFNGGLLPLGSSRLLGSHKGYGLGVMVDIFCGLLSGANYGPELPGLVSEFEDVADVGHFFAVLRVDAFRPLAEFAATMDEMIRGLKSTPTEAGEDRVYVAGEPELEEEERRRQWGIPLEELVVGSLQQIAKSRGLVERFEQLLASGPGEGGSLP